MEGSKSCNHIHRAVLKLIEQIEREHNLRIIFAVETGSRGQGFSTASSDCDVKGFFTYRYEQYLSVIDLVESFKCEKYLIDVEGEEKQQQQVEVDLSLVEFRSFAERRMSGLEEKLNWTFTSEYVYVNEIPTALFAKFVHLTIRTPLNSTLSDLDTFVSRRLSKEDVECKKVLNVLHCLLSLAHFSNSHVFGETYAYDFWRGLSLNNFIDARLRDKMKAYAEDMLSRKQHSRNATVKRHTLPPWLMQLIKFNQALPRSTEEHNLSTESPQFREVSQEIHNYLMELKGKKETEKLGKQTED